MQIPKILSLVQSCAVCPNKYYYSGGAYECSLAGQIISDSKSIAPFCPLADYPSRLIADMDTTIRMLQNQHTFGLVTTLLSHVAAKLKTTLGSNGNVEISLKDGTSLFLFHDHITAVDTYPWAIRFICGDKTYKLIPDGPHPELSEQVSAPEGKETEERWRHHELA